MKQKLFITGATGFIGTELIKTLDKSRYDILCLVRKDSNLSAIKKLNLGYVVGDIKDYGSFASSIKGADTIIHLAANLGNADRKNLYKDNVCGTKNLVKAAEKYNVRHFIHISTIAVARSVLGHYGKSKLIAEKVVKVSPVPYTILRPGMVIGKRGHGFTKFVKYIKKLPIIPITGFGNQNIQIIHVADVVKGIINAINNKKAFGKTYYLCNKRPIKYKNYIRLIRKHIKVSKPIIPLPIPIIILLGNIYKLIFGKSIITKDGMLGITLNYKFDISDSEKDLCFMPMSNKAAVRKGVIEQRSAKNHNI